MKLIDVEGTSDKDIVLALGAEYTSCLSDVRQLLDDQPTVNPQYIATVKVDFPRDEVEKIVEQKVKESIEIDVNRLKTLLMEYFRISNPTFLKYGLMFDGDFEEFNEDMIDDIIEFIKQRINNCND